MRIKTEYLDVALQTMEEKRKELSVEFNPERLDAFKKELASMLKREHYEEGDYIKDSDMEKIRDGWWGLMNDAGQNFIDKSVPGLEKRSVAEYMTVAARYLLALTFHDLKNVNGINENLPQSMAQDVARDIDDKILNYGLSTDDAFERQRGKNADELGHELDKLIVRVDQNRGTSEDLGKLYSEWQALGRRQAAHGFFWRLFHRQENLDRKELLEKMYGAMRGMNAGQDIIEDSTPEVVAKNHAKRMTGNAIRMNYLDMHGKTAKIFGYESLEQQKQQDLENQKKLEKQQKQELEKQQEQKQDKKEVAKDEEKKDRYPLVEDDNGNLLMDIQDEKPRDFGEPVNEQQQVVRGNELNMK